MRKFKVTVNGVAYHVEVAEEGVVVAAAPAAPAPAPAPAVVPKAPAAEVAAGDTPVNAPMPGKVTEVVAREGQKVKKGDILMLLEAMKMQNEIVSPVDGTVKSINIAAGQSVKPGDVMAVLS